MNLLKSPYALLLLISFFSIDAFSRLNEIDCMLNPKSCLHQAAWYQDRDNSMSPVSTKRGVGASMATIFSKVGKTQAIQVCPGVYLATAHGVLDDPKKARKDKRPQDTPSGNMYGMSLYPLSRKTIMTAKNDSSYVSPRIENPFTWSDSTTDYVFISVDNPLRPNDFVIPVRSSNKRLIEASRRGEIDIHLYRPQTRFDKDSKGTPIFSKGLQANTFDEMKPLYQAPMRVNQPCQIVRGYEGLIGADCPTEQAVSGSTYSANIDGQDYFVGLHIHGRAVSEESFNPEALPNAFVPSSHFCKDYESVCGIPCAYLDEVLSQKEI